MAVPKCYECSFRRIGRKTNAWFCSHDMGGEYVAINTKTSPKWCPLRQHESKPKENYMETLLKKYSRN